MNTIILPEVDIDSDVLAINSGLTMRNGNQFTIDSRIYELESNGTLFPVTGEGIIQTSRAVYRVMVIYSKYGGPNERSAAEIESQEWITSQDQDEASRIWKLRSR